MRRRHHSLLYTVYLGSPLWRIRRRIWILQVGGRCQRCGSRRRLTIHHHTYRRLGNEHRHDISVLCWGCHRREHQHPQRPRQPAGVAQVAARRWLLVLLIASAGVSAAYPRNDPVSPTGNGVAAHRLPGPAWGAGGRPSAGSCAGGRPARFKVARSLPRRPAGSVPLGRHTGADTPCSTTRPHTGGSRMNRLTVSGRLTQDPELHALPSGDSVCRMRLAVDGMAPGRETGYIDVATYGKPGEAAARTLTKGWLVAVDGRPEYRTWQADDGQNRHAYQVIGNVEFLAAPRRNAEGTETDSAPQQAAAA
jgi:single-strand DNA-binding protein